jgi:hypothetical protein
MCLADVGGDGLALMTTASSSEMRPVPVLAEVKTPAFLSVTEVHPDE